MCEPASLTAALLQSTNWDQDSEMARHLDITAATGAAVYVCDAGSSWRRALTRNINGFLRPYFPKGTTCPDTTVAASSASNANSIVDSEQC